MLPQLENHRRLDSFEGTVIPSHDDGDLDYVFNLKSIFILPAHVSILHEISPTFCSRLRTSHLSFTARFNHPLAYNIPILLASTVRLRKSLAHLLPLSRTRLGCYTVS